jgi:hypothetical protein
MHRGNPLKTNINVHSKYDTFVTVTFFCFIILSHFHCNYAVRLLDVLYVPLINMTIHCTYIVYFGLIVHPVGCFNPCKDLWNENK